jgi:hypothetical protein
MDKRVNYIFLLLGLFSVTLAIFDFTFESDFYGGLLAVAWGLLFIFLSVKNLIASQKIKISISSLQIIFILFVVLSGLLKLGFKLKLINY